MSKTYTSQYLVKVNNEKEKKIRSSKILNVFNIEKRSVLKHVVEPKEKNEDLFEYRHYDKHVLFKMSKNSVDLNEARQKFQNAPRQGAFVAEREIKSSIGFLEKLSTRMNKKIQLKEESLETLKLNLGLSPTKEDSKQLNKESRHSVNISSKSNLNYDSCNVYNSQSNYDSNQSYTANSFMNKLFVTNLNMKPNIPNITVKFTGLGNKEVNQESQRSTFPSSSPNDGALRFTKVPKNYAYNINLSVIKESLDKEDFETNENKIHFFPCLNCNEMIQIDSIDKHTRVCLKVKQEVLEAEKTNELNCSAIDLKLEKLSENIRFILESNFSGGVFLSNKPETLKFDFDSKASSYNEVISKEAECLTTINDIIKASIAIRKAESDSLKRVKKLILKIDSVLDSFSGSISTNVILDRTRLLMIEKMEIIKTDIKSSSKRVERKSSFNQSVLEAFKERENEKDKLEQTKKPTQERLSILKKQSSNSINDYQQQQPKHARKSSLGSTLSISTILGSSSKTIASCPLESSIDDEMNQIMNKQRLVNNKVVRKVFKEDINSECESKDFCSELSDNTSVCSMMTKMEFGNPHSGQIYGDFESELNINTLTPLKRKNENESTNLQKTNTQELNNSQISETKSEKKEQQIKEFKEFAKVMLKLKFENLSSSHPGQLIKEKTLFLESIKRGILKKDWREFIKAEFNNHQAYVKSNTTKDLYLLEVVPEEEYTTNNK